MVADPYNASGSQQYVDFSGARKGSVNAEDVDMSSARKGCLPRRGRPKEPNRRHNSSGNMKEAAYTSKMNPGELDTDIVPAGCFSGIRKGGSSTNRRGVGVFKGMLKRRRRRKGTTVGTGSSGDGSIIGLDVDCDDEDSCISDLDWVPEDSSERTMQGSGGIVALAGSWGHDETSETGTIDDCPERQALGRSSHDQESELSRTGPIVPYIRALALVCLSFILLQIKPAHIFSN